ncbi:MAG: C_GCAxxG_C_C family protein [Promethearchaeota archaeon]|nr:MAG: C_GCAxxG_C_C family protein [Candidatus Lokiarchaeota archaeon]
MSRIEEAVSYFKGNCNCAQSVLSSYSTQYGLDRDKALKISTGFGGGMARFGRTCGAVTGAYIVIGLKYGMGINNNVEAKEKTYQVIREFSERFQKSYGSVLCKELLGCDINTPEGKVYFDQNELFEKKCLQYVKNSAEILELLL